MPDFIPHSDADLNSFAINLSAKITLAPTTYGLVAGDATALATLVTAFTSALSTAVTPATRTKTSIAAKDTARAVLVADIRSLARRIQATPTVTAAQKTDLGLPIRDAVPTPVPAPSTKPTLDLAVTDRQKHIIRIADETTPTRRGRPAGTIGCEVFAHVGPTPAPAGLEDWNFKGIATKAEFDVEYAADDAGKQAQIVARWLNRKGETGPVSNPITGTIAA